MPDVDARFDRLRQDSPIPILPPDIAPLRAGNTGVDFVHVLDSSRPGPTVMVQALTHGNEICGAIALHRLLSEQAQWQVQCGRLTVAFGNLDAYARWDPAQPDRSRFVDEDFNRVWADDALFGARDSTELRRARQLRMPSRSSRSPSLGMCPPGGMPVCGQSLPHSTCLGAAW